MLIFLDIDGVMIPAANWKRPEFLDDNFQAFSSKATSALQKILSVKGSTIMLTTSHKSNFTLAQWKKIFVNRGIKISSVKALPENNLRLNRKEEILNWLEHNHIKENFVIIDDDKSLNDLPLFLKKHLVLTQPLIGLTEELADEAIFILNNKNLQFSF